MTERLEPDLAIIGGGSAGLSLAAGAVQMGASTVLIESGKMGGDCLNYGCVPSKSLIAAAHAADQHRRSGSLGVASDNPAIDMAKVRSHIAGVIATIAPHDSVERFESLGVKVIQEHGAFTGPEEIEAGGYEIRARRTVIASGSRPAIVPIPGLESVDYLTNETIFTYDGEISHLLVIGAGPIGCELAQSFVRLDARVTLLDLGPMLPRDDEDFREVVRARMLEDGVEIVEHAQIDSIAAGPSIRYRKDGQDLTVTGSHLLLSTGRSPNVEGIGLETAEIKFGKRGIEVDSRLRTTNRKVYAIGDCNGLSPFTHAAGYQASIAVKNILFRLPARANARIPYVTYTDPELAFVGETEQDLKAKGTEYQAVRADFDGNDRAISEQQQDGFCKILVSPKGKVLGAGIVGARAGELLQPWVMAVEGKVKLSDLASQVLPYPTLAEINKRVAGSYFTPRLFSERTRKLVRFLLWFG